VFKAGVVLAVAVLPFCVAGGHDHAATLQTLWSTGLPVDPDSGGTAARFAVVLLAVMWAYNGWHGITPVAEEIKDPGRNIPRALLIGVGILTVLYVSANMAYHLVVPMEEMIEGENRKKVAVLLFDRLLGPVGSKLMAVGVMVSTFGAINSNLLLGPRVPFAMGRDDRLLGWLGQVSPRFRTPARAITVQAAMGVLLLVGSTLLVESLETQAGGGPSVFDLMTGYIIFSSSIFYMLAVAAVLVLRRRHPEWERPFRVHWLVPIAYLGFYTWFLGHVLFERPVESRIGIFMSLSGIPVLLAGIVYARWRPGREAPSCPVIEPGDSSDE
jgi:amino acid transporter